MNLETQKRMAADILDVGENRVWIDPDRTAEVSTAITRQDVRGLIEDGAIRAKSKKSISRSKARQRQEQKKKGRQSGPGTRKGGKKGKKSRKEEWIGKVRPLRRKLREFRDEGKIDSSLYRDLYRKVKGGAFRSKAHLETYLKKRGILEEEE
ncbi:50S ribosomal protein L19 [candidate division MSBL1 archaeon SCGC-AAA382A20]|uniref:Large ribosomal subunit protein eL19 n=1 Tax=candidate division MSBL1 archaeon SCGC-AAA382A20 TaxID=1698280 RepID=A0A133VHC6_9EURY|nr:50S ribosomal protein L19 [candidate division MSBL1 archaeon SCGC-AAA382A20]